MWRRGEGVDKHEQGEGVKGSATGGMEMEVQGGWAALRVPAWSDVADDRAGVDDGAIDHALSERLHVRVVVVRPALTLDPDLVAAEHIGPGTGDDPSFTGEQDRKSTRLNSSH